MTQLHKNLAPVENHVIYSWSYADTAARVAATGLVTTDIGKLAWQADDDTFWVLKTIAPSWVPLAGDASAIGTGKLIRATQPINVQTGTTYTFALSDIRKLVTLDNAATIAATIPTNASVAFATGDSIDIAQLGVGQVTLTPAGGVTLLSTPGLKFRTQYSGCTIRKIATDTWLCIGDLSA